jgi:hypothetical protein
MFDRQWTLHGDSRLGVLDWEMLRAERAAGHGRLRLTAMTSLESFFLPDTGYPELLQTGESFGNRRIVNVQHPHDLIGELAAGYEYSLTSKLVISTFGAVVGEPALGPVAYRHRPSAASDPFAPLGEHWQDAAHQSHGVATVGLFTDRLKLEASAFNAREPDSNRRDIEFAGARLDSYSARLTLATVGGVVASAWAGYLADHDPLDRGTAMQRYGASMLSEFGEAARGHVSTALIWGLNNHHHGGGSHDHELAGSPATHHLSSSVLLESTLGIGDRADLFARLEQVQKTADDLGFLGGNPMETFNVRAASIGGSRTLLTRAGIATAIGARLGYNFLPATLRYTYTTTHPAGFAVWLRLLPAKHPRM